MAFLPSPLPWPLWLLARYLNSRTSALENREMQNREMRYIRELCVRFHSFLEENLNYSYHTKGAAFKLSQVSIGNSIICSDIWHKYHEWYLPLGEWNLRQFWNITSGIFAKYHVQIILLFVYTTTRKRLVIFTYRYFKLSWNPTALSQSDCRNLWCSSIK